MKARLESSALLAAAVLAGWAGSAGAQISQNMELKSNFNLYPRYSDIWGYTHTDGSEYALVGAVTGVSIVNVTDPENPYQTGFIATPTSIWQDIKTYQTYGYCITESGDGLIMFDLSNPEIPLPLGTFPGIQTAHNLYIDEAAGRLYTAGADAQQTLTRGTTIFSLANPILPQQIGVWNNEYFHDVMVQDNILYGSAIHIGRLIILDVSNPSQIVQLGQTTTGLTHNAWVTADGNYVMTTDEHQGAACRLFDISNLPTVTPTDLYLPWPSSIPHNAHIKGSLAIISHYTVGVRVVDISDPFDIVEMGFYDTYPNNNGGSFDGCWGVFPFFPLSPNKIVAADINTGLYVLEYIPEDTGTSAPLQETAAASELALGPGSPNPFRASRATTLELALPASGRVSATVHDVTGKRVAVLADGVMESGRHELRWDGRGDGGAGVPAGVYFVSVRTDAGTASRKVVVVP